MIASVRGVVEALGHDFVVVNVGGVGLQVFVPASTLASVGSVGDSVRLHTHLYFREDILALYGFTTLDEMRLFKMFLGVGGLGPKTSMSALSTMRPGQLVSAIVSEDLAALSRIPGVGKKTAARIALELKGPLSKDGGLMNGFEESTGPVDADAVAALMSLGYALAEARTALGAIKDVQTLPLDEQVRRALQRMGS